MDWWIGVNFERRLNLTETYNILSRHISATVRIWIAATDYYMYFYIIVIFPLTAINSPVNKFYSFIIFSLLNCLVLILNLYMHFLSLRCSFFYLNIIWTLTLLCKYPNLCTVSLLQYLMVLKTVSPGCGVEHL